MSAADRATYGLKQSSKEYRSTATGDGLILDGWDDEDEYGKDRFIIQSYKNFSKNLFHF